MIDTLFSALGSISGVLGAGVLVAFGILLLSPGLVRSHRLVRRFVEYVGNVEIGNSGTPAPKGAAKKGFKEAEHRAAFFAS
jgi:hypothetical protein